MRSPFIQPDEYFEKDLLEGVRARIVAGEKMMMCEISLAPGSVIPRHSHPHEQGGRCLGGEFELEIAGETRTIREGDSYMIPGDVPHSVRNTSDQVALTLDIFHPLRDEYLPPENMR